eukprot:TRINITY_DN32244_c0_g1_i1.p1 TRINITY_DN32244_c0_g1~~TRINITY_DN32244_c0_g1_i1.p1  ORF type:complete len:450 (-),score=67.35 TRINITY_DN32244_c0_g1_i1:585-1853(-)
MGASASLMRSAPIAQAVANGDVAHVQAILDQSVDPNMVCSQYIDGTSKTTSTNEWRAKPVHVASNLKKTEILQLLVARRADINAQTAHEKGSTPWTIGAQDGNRDLLGKLLELRANVEAPRADGRNAVDVAKEYHQEEILGVLLAKGRMFSKTTFKTEYDLLAPPTGTFQVTIQDMLIATGGVLDSFARARPELNISSSEKAVFLHNLQASCVKQGEPVEMVVERLWTCAANCCGAELCHMLNLLLCMDTDVQQAALFVRALNTFCVTGAGRGSALQPVQWPQDNIVFRAGGLPKEHRIFFDEMCKAGGDPKYRGKYRAPRVLPTSFEYREEFALRPGQTEDPVKWIIRLPESRKCHQANYVTNRADGVPDEREFLFAAYTVFVVHKVAWSDRPWEKPHEIILAVPVDNRDEPDDLPIAPWC